MDRDDYMEYVVLRRLEALGKLDTRGKRRLEQLRTLIGVSAGKQTSTNGGTSK